MLHLQIRMDNQDREQVNKKKGKMQRIEKNYNQEEKTCKHETEAGYYKSYCGN